MTHSIHPEFTRDLVVMCQLGTDRVLAQCKKGLFWVGLIDPQQRIIAWHKFEAHDFNGSSLEE
jgi:hypothetical protein